MSILEKPATVPLTQLESFIRAEHFRYRCFAKDGPAADEFALPACAGLVLEAPATPLLDQALADFATFCATCLGVTVVPNATPAAVRLRLTGSAGNRPYDVLGPAGEAFTVTVSAASVLVEAAHERGLLHATHHLERRMADRGGPYLALGQRQVKPAFAPRITTAMSFALSDEYLSLLSHFGANGLLLHAELKDVARSRLMPEFNAPGADKFIASLNEKTALLHRHGFDSYILLNSRPLTADHPVFGRDPARRGAPYRVFDDMATQYVLCNNNVEVQALYAEVIEKLFRDVPGAAGAILLVGGEGFMHCYSRPLSPFTGYSSCPHCAAHEPSAPVAELVNRIAAAVKRTGSHKPVFAWPYSAFTWSGADRAQLGWMEKLGADVLVLGNFDTNSPDERNGAGVYLYDYNIKSIGPSAVFRAQAAKAAAMGRRIYTKTESNVTPSVFFPPCIPVHFRWHARFRAMAELGVAGYLNQWYFYGMSGSLPDELQYHAGWSPAASAEELLSRAAVRDFGVNAPTARRVVDGWRKLSAAWDDFPYSAMTNGEREFYARGPLHYGPAHPLIFNVQNRYGLPASFFGLSGDLAALATPAEVERLLRDAKPRYVSELLLTLPYGVDRYLELIGRCRQQWAAGLAELQQALGPTPNERARMELDVCELLNLHLTTIEHVVRFYVARERLWRTPVGIPAFKGIIAELETLLRAEIANAEHSLPILARDCRFKAYDAAMVQAKLRQCHYVLEQELPIFSVTVRFHVWNDYP